MDYNDVRVTLRWHTQNPIKVVCEAAGITMKRNFDFKDVVESKKMIARLLTMKHTSVFEHVVFGFFIDGASRAFLAQVTRHRMCSYTSGSQHYQDHQNFSYLYPNGLSENGKKRFDELVRKINEEYTVMKNAGLDISEARMLLPNACCNKLLVTINARSLVNLFELRLCNRNVMEMRIVVHKIYNLVMAVFPELFGFVGPSCFMDKKCNQGSMKCEKGYWEKV
tara:strand:+ start:1216 stop:1884 length:669 start_codon:yes stop_codon:yes gene_type:complete